MSHADSTSIRSPKGGIINVALVGPANLSVDRKPGYLWSRKHNSWVVGTLLGQTSYYNNSAEAIARSASLRSRTGSTGSLHCWGGFMGSRTPSSNVGREGLHLVPSGLTRTESLPRENKRREGGIALIEGSILKVGKESLYDLAHNYQIQTTYSSCQFHLRWLYTISVKQVLGAPLHGGCCEGVNGDVIVHRKEGQASED